MRFSTDQYCKKTTADMPEIGKIEFFPVRKTHDISISCGLFTADKIEYFTSE